jgi:hypothetical protein
MEPVVSATSRRTTTTRRSHPADGHGIRNSRDMHTCTVRFPDATRFRLVGPEWAGGTYPTEEQEGRSRVSTDVVEWII